jgi:hypothetical protein
MGKGVRRTFAGRTVLLQNLKGKVIAISHTDVINI